MKDLQTLISNHDVISFDIFDTALIRRGGHHSSTFILVQKALQSREISLHYPAFVENFVWIRKEAEAAARRERAKEEGDSDTTLQEIYDVVAEEGGIPLEEAMIVARLETEIERSQLVANAEIYEMWKYARTQNKTIIFTSDMFHSSSTLAQWLLDTGYASPDAIVSCEHRCSKHTGTLYLILQERFPSQSILHIGDNELADYESPKAYGISSYHYQYEPTYSTHSDAFLCDDPLRTLALTDPWEQIGAGIFGPLVVGFLAWVHANTTPDVPVVFIARDGFLLHQLMEQYFPDRTCIYLQASRIATLQASLFDFDLSKISRHIAGRTPRSVHDLLQTYGIEQPAQFTYAVERAGFRALQSVVIKENQAQFTHLLMMLQTELQRAGVEAQRYAEAYIRECVPYDHFTLVDLGWSGSVQLYLSQILNVRYNVTIDGLYYQLWNLPDFKRTISNNTYRAYARETHAPHMLTYALQHGGVEMLENVLSDPAGTVLRYADLGPVREDYEHPQAFEIGKLQQGIRKYIEAIYPLISHLHSSTLIMYSWNEPFVRLVLFPTEQDVSCIGALEHSDGAGAISGRSVPLAPFARPNMYDVDKEQAYWTQGYVLRNQMRTT